MLDQLRPKSRSAPHGRSGASSSVQLHRSKSDSEIAKRRRAPIPRRNIASSIRKVSGPQPGPLDSQTMATSSRVPKPKAERPDPTLAEIARLAGVSAPTVSKVVNGRAEVAAETRAHVQKVLREHGYRRRKKAVKPAPLLELVFHELAGIYPIEIINGVERVADEHQLAVVVSE